MARFPHTKATKHLATQLNRGDRRDARLQLRTRPDEVELRQPKGRAIYASY